MLTTTDYVSAVIGVFIVLLSVYWLAYGKHFEGPVSKLLFMQ